MTTLRVNYVGACRDGGWILLPNRWPGGVHIGLTLHAPEFLVNGNVRPNAFQGNANVRLEPEPRTFHCLTKAGSPTLGGIWGVYPSGAAAIRADAVGEINAAGVFRGRVGADHAGARAAWTRLMQNHKVRAGRRGHRGCRSVGIVGRRTWGAGVRIFHVICGLESGRVRVFNFGGHERPVRFPRALASRLRFCFRRSGWVYPPQEDRNRSKSPRKAW